MPDYEAMMRRLPEWKRTYLETVTRLSHERKLEVLRKIEQELALHLRNQHYIDEIKRHCGVSNSEGK